ncbi:origin recognition complex subunit 2-domain-containing protein [Lophiotrema nucula]|uniref:Origin recognition complex subunit 2 n=1 Tax=Lophiotrema nucula TaxID=690887 RepID=A0A6A5Z5Y2_9PLEO|nr:origin recognition complex subunit 2-domain-containing protein [Lophiotrema nucula]
MVSAKRKRDDEAENATPRKLRAREPDKDNVEEVLEIETPSRRARARQIEAEEGTPKSILKKTSAFDGINGTTPKSKRKLLFTTPSKTTNHETSNGTPTLVRSANRSARRKSNRKLIERTINGADSDDEALDEEEELAEQILSDEDEEEDAVAGAEQEIALVPDTPSKRGRGRPRGSGRPRKQRSPTPPQDLPAHEEYFWQNRPAGNKTSNNTLSAQTLLNHDEYFETMQSYQDRHGSEMEFLLELHSRAYDQWLFELEEGFNICLYGYGSKRPITEAFTAHLYEDLLCRVPYKGTKKTPKIVIINGYSPGSTVKEILTTVASAVVPGNFKLPNQPASLLAYLLQYLSDHPPSHAIHVVINSIDSTYLRKSPAPNMLAALAAQSSINLICTADTPNFPLLWDVGLKAQYKFLFHDATTFAPYDAEIDVVETVNELLGRSGRRVGGRDGVGFVLRSLPENARSLFRILVSEQLAMMYEDGGQFDQDDVTATPRNKKITATKPTSESTQGVEYRVLYHKAVEEFVCSSEVGFRTLLKEFHDHQMIESRKDTMGTERLWVPFRQEELESLVEELSGELF